jgi:lipoyl(octanoyl) transferase
MMPPVFRFLDSGAMRGEDNMAFDVARALEVSEGAAPPLLRVYQWQPWCISLGRHQDEADIERERAARDGIDIVRRPTGGRAILHAEELTYSVVMPHEGRGILEIYKLISEALVAGLNLLVPGVEMAKTQPDFQKLYKEPGSIPCFSSSARYEIEFEGRKLVGSAQRRIGNAVLQHGSLLLGDAHLRLSDYLALDENSRRDIRSDMERHTISLRRIAGREATFEEMAECLRRGFEQSWGLSLTVVRKNAYIAHQNFESGQ